MQDLLAARFGIGVGSRFLTALPSTGTAAIELFPIGGMTIAHQSVALTVRAVNGDGNHERLLFLSGIGPHSLLYPAYLCHYQLLIAIEANSLRKAANMNVFYNDA
jgi:hypothetical protein